MNWRSRLLEMTVVFRSLLELVQKPLVFCTSFVDRDRHKSVKGEDCPSPWKIKMNLLHAIYVSPVDLLDKARRDGQSLTQALSIRDESAVRDSLFNFAISTYHLRDWIKAFRPELKEKVSYLLNNSDSLMACRDLCNASKHVTLDLDNGSYFRYPPTVDDVSISATARTSLPNMMGVLAQAANEDIAPTSQPSESTWRLKIQLKNGRRIAAEDLVSEAISSWEPFFSDNHIQ